MINLILSLIMIFLIGFSITIFCLDYIKSVNKLLILPFTWFSGCVIITSFFYLTLLLANYNFEIDFMNVSWLIVPVLILCLVKFNSIKSFFNFSLSLSNLLTKAKFFKEDFKVLYLSNLFIEGIIVVLIILIFIINLVKPAWAWDSWMIWNLKAKLIYFDLFNSQFFSNTFYSYSHMDYPLLVPAVQAYIAKFQISFDERYSQIFFSTSFLAFIITLYSYSRHFIGKLLTNLYILSCICAPSLLLNFIGGYADCILASYLLLVLLIIYFTLIGKAEYAHNSKEFHLEKILLLIIAFSGLIMTKNEGLSISFVVILLSIILIIYRKTKKITILEFIKSFKLIVIAISGALLLSLPWFVIKQTHHLSNDVVNLTSLYSLSYLTVINKLPKIVDFIININLFNTNFWGIFYFIFPLFVAIGLYEKKFKLTCFFICGFFINLLILVGIYLLSPHDLKSHLTSSSDRYILAISPFLFCYIPALFAKESEERLE